MKTPLYSVSGQKGAHLLLGVRSTEQGEIADVQYIGAPLPFSVAREKVQPFTQTEAVEAPEIPTLESLAQEAATAYELEPRRIIRAVEILRTAGNVQQAHFDFLGEPIKPTLARLIVKGRQGFYLVERGHCPCKDHQNGHICKHRIAAWIFREQITRTHATLRRVDKAVIMAEMGA